MRGLNFQELVQIVIELQSLVGAQLQEVLLSNHEFGLAFYHDRQMVWLWFDLNTQAPVLLRFMDNPPRRSKETKPVLLFFRAHFVGRRLLSVRTHPDWGRVVEMTFHDPEGQTYRVEIRLIPRAVNVALYAGEKQLFWHKPKDLPSAPVVQEGAPRSWADIQNEWSGKKIVEGAKRASADEVPAHKQSERAQRDWERDVEKKRKAIEKLQQEIVAKQSAEWARVGEWLKEQGHLNVPAEWVAYVDPQKSLAENIQNNFAKAKDNKRKLAGTQQRLQQVQEEVEVLLSRGPQSTVATAPTSTAKTLLEVAQARGRTFVLDAQVSAYLGKSAADNLRLLRRAQPFDYWLHLRDYPGAYVIVRRPRGRIVNDTELQKIATWLVAESVRKPLRDLKGEKLDVLVAECRYVRPIKGDKLGRVTYQNERVLTVVI